MIASALMCLCFAAACEGDAKAAPVETPKAVKLSAVLSLLRAEASERLKEDDAWEVDGPDFAARKNWQLPPDEVVKALTRKLDGNPIVDAYVKWQLLSFDADYEKLDGATVEKIMQFSPQPLEHPVVKEEWLATSTPARAYFMNSIQQSFISDVNPVVGNGAVAQDPIVSVLNTGVVHDVEAYATLRRTIIYRINQRLDSDLKAIGRANQAVHHFHEELARRVPEREGLRMGVMIRDLKQRIAAGDPTSEGLVTSLVEYSEKLPGEDVISAGARKQLIKWVKQVAGFGLSVVESLELTDKGKVKANREVIAMREEDAKLLIERLTPQDDGVLFKPESPDEK